MQTLALSFIHYHISYYMRYMYQYISQINLKVFQSMCGLMTRNEVELDKVLR